MFINWLTSWNSFHIHIHGNYDLPLISSYTYFSHGKDSPLWLPIILRLYLIMPANRIRFMWVQYISFKPMDPLRKSWPRSKKATYMYMYAAVFGADSIRWGPLLIWPSPWAVWGDPAAAVYTPSVVPTRFSRWVGAGWNSCTCTSQVCYQSLSMKHLGKPPMRPSGLSIFTLAQWCIKYE